MAIASGTTNQAERGGSSSPTAVIKGPRTRKGRRVATSSTASEAVYRWELDDLAQPVFDALGTATQALPGFAGDLGVQSDSSAGVLDGQ